MTTDSRDEKTKEYKAASITNGEVFIKELDYEIDGLKIINNVSFKISDGEKIGLVGNIGSGKTSLIRNIIGFHLPTRGSVNLSGYDINNIPAKILRNHIGYCPQKIQLLQDRFTKILQQSRQPK